MWLPWKPAVGLALLCLVPGFGLRTAAGRKQRSAAALARETALVLALYSIWQLAGTLSVMQVNGAEQRGRWLVDFQRALHVPSEASLQRLVLPHPLWVQFCNGYYAIVHVPALIAFLIWAFLRDRSRYARWRTTMALSTAACLAIQLIPVAPPRMLSDLGFVDTALLYKQSVYSALGRGVAGQLAAMPSVHVAWALIVALGMWQITASKWRWLGIAHAVVTVVVVSATANHYWADGAVAAALIGAAFVLESKGRPIGRRLWLRVAGPAGPARSVRSGSPARSVSSVEGVGVGDRVGVEELTNRP